MILQSQLPYDIFAARLLPGIAPLGEAAWLLADEAYAAQMAHRCALLRDRRDAVLAEDAPSQPALEEMLDEVLARLPEGFEARDDHVVCPDGRRVGIDRSRPLLTLGQIVQEDICLLEKRGSEHVLTAAVLCFPASWRLAEKIGRPLIDIHTPVPEYDADLARRVQRLFDGIRVGQPLWRFNALWYEDPELHQPRSVHRPRALTDPGTAPYLRSERQVLWRLPQTRAVLFTIHTYMLPRAAIQTRSAE